ncbi:hypothetical protein IL306_005357 [Fusarium sp. DS 682]|nr:hypothetical protein IL306_005357 [Fusarium sp. DS 682]
MLATTRLLIHQFYEDMDPLSALGIAAAVVQFVDFGQRLLSETWHVYRSAAGQDLELHELSTISRDLTQIAQAVRTALDQQQQGGSSGTSQHVDAMLLRVCRECDAIAEQIEGILPQINVSFKRELKGGKRGENQFFFIKDRPVSIGEAFRRALRTLWKGKEVDDLKMRLIEVRQQIMMAVTMSIWYTSQDSRGWEKQFSDKVDTMIETLDQAVENTVNTGPGRLTYKKEETGTLVTSQASGGLIAIGSDQRINMTEDKDGATHAGRGEGIGPIESKAIESIVQSRVAKEIVSRLWRKDWEPEDSVLSTFPQKSPFSPEELESAIRDSLSFSSMDNREEAISETFKSTYHWMFSRTPRLLDTGEPMWSSLPDWLESNSRLPYWITGKPGAGKSTAMKYIANNSEIDQYLFAWAQGIPIHKTKYYAWKPGLDMAKSEQGLLRTLLYQTLRDNPKLVPIICPRRWTLFHIVRELDLRDVPSWSDWELHESFSRLLKFAKDKIRLVIFVDGLDEFDVAPVQLCSLIRDIAQHEAIKICVASRPWPQFSDAFADSPGMQMHLLTHDDINRYVFDHFTTVRAFQELNSIYQKGGDELLNQLVSKSDGVFLWTAIVTQTIYQSLVEGASLSQLQSILDKMPPEIENLYDAIYLTIPERLLPEVSVMLQIHVSSHKPVHWMTLWLADETRGTKMSIDFENLDLDQVLAALKRRLSARTRGILEAVRSTQTVDFLHRTAAEWVKQPRVWKQLRSVSPAGFDPYLSLLRAEIIDMENTGINHLQMTDDVWRSITGSLLYASLADDNVVPERMLADAVDQLHQAANVYFSLHHISNIDTLWPSYQFHVNLIGDPPRNSFHGLAVQFSLLPYIRREFEAYPSQFHPVPDKGSKALLEQAIFGFETYSARTSLFGLDESKIPNARRLDTIAYLVSKGVRQAGISSRIKRAENNCKKTGREHDLPYYNDVKHLLQCMNALGDGKRAYVKERFGIKIKKWLG